MNNEQSPGALLEAVERARFPDRSSEEWASVGGVEGSLARFQSHVQTLADGGRLAARAAAQWMHQAAQGLHAAHGAGLVHGELNPSNILIDANGYAEVADLGRTWSHGDADGSLRGSAAYAAPEQLIGGRTVDARADVYGLGATFYRALAGTEPSVVRGEFVVPEARSPDEAADYQCFLRLIWKMMSFAPADRPSTMADVSAALADAGLIESGTPPRESELPITPSSADPTFPTVHHHSAVADSSIRVPPVTDGCAIVDDDSTFGLVPVPTATIVAERAPYDTPVPSLRPRPTSARPASGGVPSPDSRTVKLPSPLAVRHAVQEVGESKPPTRESPAANPTPGVRFGSKRLWLWAFATAGGLGVAALLVAKWLR